MNHQEYTQKRDEITKKYVNNPVFEPIAAQAIDALVLQVIGEDDPDSYSKTCEYCEDWEDGRQEKLDVQRRIVTGGQS